MNYLNFLEVPCINNIELFYLKPILHTMVHKIVCVGFVSPVFFLGGGAGGGWGLLPELLCLHFVLIFILFFIYFFPVVKGLDFT